MKISAVFCTFFAITLAVGLVNCQINDYLNDIASARPIADVLIELIRHEIRDEFAKQAALFDENLTRKIADLQIRLEREIST